MKTLSHIATILLSAIFLLSSSGFVMYKTNCSCTGEERVSVFVTPETCEQDFHYHHKHQDHNTDSECSADHCEECTNHIHDCGCDSPEIFFFKLKDKAVDEGVKFLIASKVNLHISKTDVFNQTVENQTSLQSDLAFVDPPPNIKNSLDFLIEIQQLKIPGLC